MSFEFSRLSSDQLKALSPEKTVFFFSVGPLEDHGPALPMGIDLLEAYQLCFSSAQRLERELPGWTGVLMPPAPLGVEANTQNIALTVRPHVLRDWLVDACRNLRKIGFRHFVCFSGHLGPKQLTAIEDAAKIITRRSRFLPSSKHCELVSASSVRVSAADLKESLFWPDPKEHGGARDASVTLWLKQISEPEKLKNLIKQERPDSWLTRGSRRISGKTSGYWGDPGQASEEAGRKEVSTILDQVFPKLRAVWQGSNPNSLFRSYYSIVPFNKSFFKAWVLAFIALILLLSWYMMNFRSIAG
jgi:creatinine amidohydrolase/Fe(II)-dependent formamide hydrolase-like protein